MADPESDVERCDVCADGEEECGCDGDEDCISCSGTGWRVPEHCCSCGGSPYCTTCHTCGGCVGECSCPIELKLSDGSTRIL